MDVGDPGAVCVEALDHPDYGDPPILDAAAPVFWACGRPPAIVLESRVDLTIIHAPGHMLITDAQDADDHLP